MERYKRQMQLSEVGKSGQQKLTSAKVLVIGAGGLGCAILPYLASSGIGNIGIMDGDTIGESNLHGQILYSKKNLGQSKVKFAKKHLEHLNSDIKVHAFNHYLSGKNAIKIFNDYDIIVDATDNLPTRYLINDACIIANKPFVYGSVYKFEGQVAVFNYKNGPTYRCLFESNETEVPNCETSGVLGTTVGLIGMLQANETMKLILETGGMLSGKLLIYNTLNNSQSCIEFAKNDKIRVDESFFSAVHLQTEIAEISLVKALENKLVFLDVREYGELPKVDLPNTIQLPLSVIEKNISGMDKDTSYAVFCQSGKRSRQAVKLFKESEFKNVFNINGGVKSIKKNNINETSFC